ncbi:MAG TPA: hypothetical protein VFN97_14400 [Actinospica sp.]|nr:hypothetical protein [Actinospica sp.]
MATSLSRRYSGLGAVIMLIVGVIVVILVLHIVLVLLGANPGNTLVSTDADWARHLAAWFDGLFNTSSAKWNVVLDYGIAAIVYLVVGRLLAGVTERF